MASEDFDLLFKLLDSYCIGQVKNLLGKSFSHTNVGEVVANSHEGIFLHIKSVNEKKAKKVDAFAGYARRIYSNSTRDIHRDQKRKPTEPIIDNDGNIIDIPANDTTYEDDRRRSASVKVYHIYCPVIFNSELYADGLLAFCYARLLPHMLDEIVETKATSPKWAYKRMEGKSFDELRRESEEIIREELQDKTLTWGQSFLDKLSELIEVDGDRVKRGDAIYTKLYDQKQIGHKENFVFEETFKKVCDIVKDRDDIRSVFEDYYTKDTVIGELIRGGKAR
ncbi:MAG: hypothetical protein LUG86_04885 [Oscillospiraceae bacterium]|nr:hypothetical protein [Oscillospiraceae bacterium]